MTAPVSVISASELAGRDVELGTRIYRVPPGELTVGLNTRVDVGNDPDFASSVRERGVLQAITCYVHDGALQVLMGQRRALVAAAEGLEWVPVVITAPPDDEARLIDQLVENEHRAPITTADRAAAVAQLSLLGLSAEQLVRRTALRRVDVEHALAVAASPVASAAAAAAPELDLGQAAAVAEFDDEPDVVEKLTTAAGTGRFDHVLQRARDDRDEAAERARLLEEIRASGVTALEAIDFGHHKTLAALGITAGRHRRCPGHAAYPAVYWSNVDNAYRAEPTYVCTEPGRHRDGAAAAGTGQGATLAEEQARQQRAQVISRNKEWRSATEVRRAWLRDFVRRQRPPAGAEAFVAAALVRFDHEVIDRAAQTQHVLLRELLAPLGSEEPATVSGRTEIDDLAGRAAAMAPKRALVLAAATLLAAWEYGADEHTWRDHPHDPLGGHRGVDRFYLGQMAAWGYPLAEVEQLVVELGDLPDGAT